MTDVMEKENHAIANARGWLEEIRILVLKLNDDGLTDEQRDQARQDIEEGPLSVLVRDGWRGPYQPHNDEGPEEYEILLATGGPALRIYGGLDQYAQPDDDPRLQWQDWGVAWTDYPLDHEERDAVAAYARCFYFGEG